MLKRLLGISVLFVIVAAVNAGAEETIVFFRHGEKPSGDFGQLTCQGLNRALALPKVLLPRYGSPDWLYAPNPSVKVGGYFYVRPLATIEPTAIRVVKSVNTNYGYNNLTGLQSVLIKSTKANDTIFVAWEHAYLVKAVQNIMNAYGGGALVPAWQYGDYDSLYVVRVNYTSSGPRATFDIDHEGLNGLPTSCPE